MCGALGTKLKKILYHNQKPQELNKFLCIVQIFYVLYLLSARKTWRITALSLTASFPNHCNQPHPLRTFLTLPTPSSSPLHLSPTITSTLYLLAIFSSRFFFILLFAYLFTYLSIPSIICFSPLSPEFLLPPHSLDSSFCSSPTSWPTPLSFFCIFSCTFNPLSFILPFCLFPQQLPYPNNICVTVVVPSENQYPTLALWF